MSSFIVFRSTRIRIYYPMKYQILGLCLLVLCSCSDDDATGPVISPFSLHSVQMYDVDNSGTASDIIVNYKLPPNSNATEIRSYLVRGSDFSLEDPIRLSDLQSASYGAIIIANENIDFILESSVDLKFEQQFVSSQRDIKGNPIQSGVEYFVVFELVGASGSVLAAEKGRITLRDVNPYVGAYRTDDGVATLLLELGDDGWFNGSVFYTRRFVPCCGEFMDARMRFRMVSDGSIVDFELKEEPDSGADAIPCPGGFSGFGNVLSYKEIYLEFSGSGCRNFVPGLQRITKQ